MSRIVVDITELVDWTGKLTGVPRVMNELAHRFSEENDIIFGHWNKDRRIFEPAEYIAPISSPDARSVADKEGFIEVLKRLIRRSAIASKTTAMLVTNLKRIKRKTYSLLTRKEEIHLLDTDILVVLADWHGSDPYFIDFVKSVADREIKLVQFSYDLLPLVAPQYSGHSTKTLRRYAKNIYPLCDRIIAISEHTKMDIETWLASNNLRVPSVDVIRLGDDFQTVRAVKPDHIQLNAVTADRYLLTVGTIEARKNHTILYYAYKQALIEGIYLPPVVIVGRAGWLAGDIYQIMTLDPEVKDKFVFVDNISDSELSWLYENCYYTIYPSFYEGWGLPVAESIARHVPCLCSNTSSIPEIAGDKLRYFSPYDPRELFGQMKQMEKPQVYNEAKVAIKSYKPTSWDNTYKAVMQAVKGNNND